MDPKIMDLWENAKRKLRKAKDHLKAGEIEVATAEAQNAACFGDAAIILVLVGREHDDIAAFVTYDPEPFRDLRICSRPQDYIAKVETLLKYYSNLSPPENKLPFD